LIFAVLVVLFYLTGLLFLSTRFTVLSLYSVTKWLSIFIFFIFLSCRLHNRCYWRCTCLQSTRQQEEFEYGRREISCFPKTWSLVYLSTSSWGERI